MYAGYDQTRYFHTTGQPQASDTACFFAKAGAGCAAEKKSINGANDWTSDRQP